MSKEMVDKIETLAKANGKTLKEIGKESGVGENAIYRWRYQVPRFATLKKVADVLNVDYKVLLP